MELIYKYSESTIKPDTVSIGKTTAYLRKDIVQEERTNPDGSVQTFWTYQEAMMPIAEFNSYAGKQAHINAVKGANDSDNLNMVIENGLDSTNNRLILMEALADLYELIARMI